MAQHLDTHSGGARHQSWARPVCQTLQTVAAPTMKSWLRRGRNSNQCVTCRGNRRQRCRKTARRLHSHQEPKRGSEHSRRRWRWLDSPTPGYRMPWHERRPICAEPTQRQQRTEERSPSRPAGKTTRRGRIGPQSWCPPSAKALAHIRVAAGGESAVHFGAPAATRWLDGLLRGVEGWEGRFPGTLSRPGLLHFCRWPGPVHFRQPGLPLFSCGQNKALPLRGGLI